MVSGFQRLFSKYGCSRDLRAQRGFEKIREGVAVLASGQTDYFQGLVFWAPGHEATPLWMLNNLSRHYMGDCQNYGPFLGPYYNTGPNTGPD